MPKHLVAEGESVNSIAAQHGRFWQVVWNHPDNAELKRQRKDPDILQAGDELFVPELRVREESGATEKRHRFRRKGVPARLALVVTRSVKPAENERVESETMEWWDVKETAPQPLPSEPDADAPFELLVDGVWAAEGQADSSGRLEVSISPTARSATLVLHRGTPRERGIELNLRHMDPIASLSGVGKRLNNLGFPCPVDLSETNPELRGALGAFQKAHRLEVTGEPDNATRDKLVAIHGG